MGKYTKETEEFVNHLRDEYGVEFNHDAYGLRVGYGEERRIETNHAFELNFRKQNEWGGRVENTGFTEIADDDEAFITDYDKALKFIVTRLLWFSLDMMLVTVDDCGVGLDNPYAIYCMYYKELSDVEEGFSAALIEILDEEKIWLETAKRINDDYKLGMDDDINARIKRCKRQRELAELMKNA